MKDASTSPDPSAAPAPASQPGIRIERLGFRAMLTVQPAWSDLIDRVAEPNVFLDPAFALPLLQHVQLDHRPEFLLAWEDGNAKHSRRLLGLLPLYLPASGGFAVARVAKGFHHPQIVLGVPLLDTIRGAAAFEAMLAWLGEQLPHLHGLILTGIPTAGPFCTALRDQSAANGRSIAFLD